MYNKNSKPSLWLLFCMFYCSIEQIKAYSFNIIDLVLMVRTNKKCFNKKHSTCCCDEVTIDRIISIESVMCWCI